MAKMYNINIILKYIKTFFKNGLCAVQLALPQLALRLCLWKLCILNLNILAFIVPKISRFIHYVRTRLLFLITNKYTLCTETLPSACYESSIPFYSTSKGYRKGKWQLTKALYFGEHLWGTVTDYENCRLQYILISMILVDNLNWWIGYPKKGAVYEFSILIYKLKYLRDRRIYNLIEICGQYYSCMGTTTKFDFSSPIFTTFVT